MFDQADLAPLVVIVNIPEQDEPLPPIVDNNAPKRVFLTSELYDGNLGGLNGADKKCQGLADAADLGGIYKAWLTDSNESPQSRFAKTLSPIVLVDGTQVFSSSKSLLSGNIVWTGDRDSDPSTRSTKDFCKEWTSRFDQNNPGTLSGGFGLFPAFNLINWTRSSRSACDSKLPLYCFEQ